MQSVPFFKAFFRQYANSMGASHCRPWKWPPPALLVPDASPCKVWLIPMRVQRYKNSGRPLARSETTKQSLCLIVLEIASLRSQGASPNPSTKNFLICRLVMPSFYDQSNQPIF